jgi:hypothetical protein
VLLTGPAVANTGSSSILLAVEQRKDLKIQPVQVASTDPAFISGLMSSGRDEPEEPGGEAAEGVAEASADLEGDGTGQDDAAVTAEADAEAGTADADASAESPDAAPESAAEASENSEDAAASAAAPDGPSFEASDRRGSVVVDAVGVRFTLDDQAAEWTWDEIGAVEYETSRFGRRLTVTVHTPERRWYPGEVQAPDKATLKEWTARLDDVLDVYFEDEEEPPFDDASDETTGAGASAGTDADEADTDTEAEATGSKAETEPEAEAQADADGTGDEAAAEKPEAKPEPKAKAGTKTKAKAEAKTAAQD